MRELAKLYAMPDSRSARWRDPAKKIVGLSLTAILASASTARVSSRHISAKHPGEVALYKVLPSAVNSVEQVVGWRLRLFNGKRHATQGT
jgi:hypothetical protein